MNKEKVKYVASTTGWTLFLMYVCLSFLIVCVVSLDISFGIAPHAGFIAGYFILSMIYGIILRIGSNFKKSKKLANITTQKRLLRVEFLQERGQI